MNLEWREITLPDFGVPEERPLIPAAVYISRCQKAYAAAGADWLVVYGDREHAANLTYLTNFDPRFEEAALLLGPGDQRILLVGNEGLGYVSLAGLSLEVLLCQPFSLMGQDRTQAPRLDNVLKDAGIRPGHTVGLVGWKYLAEEETLPTAAGFFVPSILVESIKAVVGDHAGLRDATAVLMHPTDGLRANNEVEQIAAFEWAAARATRAILRIVRSVTVGMSELEAISQMGYAGEPLSAHVMFASGRDSIVGLRSPTARRIQQGDGATTALGYWGGLGCRAGLVDTANPEFLEKLAVPYYRGVLTWYQTVGLGIKGEDVYQPVVAALAEGGLQSLLNPGHLTSFDEWVHTPIRPGSADEISSGMAFQCDIIPTPLPAGWAVNCEDPVVFADEVLRGQLQQRYPAVWSRIAERQQFMRSQLGIDIADELLPLSSMPAYFPPLWLASTKVLAIG